MTPLTTDRRMVWLLAGVLAGLALAQFWPQEELHAMATDRSEKFAVTTVDVGPGMPEAVFVLDFLTGRLTGALMNSQSGRFTNFYYRNIAGDFSAGKAAKYALIPGTGIFTSGQGATSATGVLYIGELTTGKLAAYRFVYRNTPDPIPQPLPLEIADFYPFRETEGK
jgi:hypothetical protein